MINLYSQIDPTNPLSYFHVIPENWLKISPRKSYNSESPNKPSLNFGEIELQLNSFQAIDNASHGKATHQLFAYIGTKEEILKVVEKYFGINNPELF